MVEIIEDNNGKEKKKTMEAKAKKAKQKEAPDGLWERIMNS